MLMATVFKQRLPYKHAAPPPGSETKPHVVVLVAAKRRIEAAIAKPDPAVDEGGYGEEVVLHKSPSVEVVVEPGVVDGTDVDHARVEETRGRL